LKTMCAWCNRETGEKDDKGVNGTSHGICKECFTRLMRELEDEIHTDRGNKNDARF
jgi:hypothetical protein